MVHIRSLLWLLFLLNALKHYSLAQPVDNDELVLAEDTNVVSAAGKEFGDGFKAARRIGFGRGRKMIVEEVKREKENEKMGSKKKNNKTGKEEKNEVDKFLQVSQHQHLNHYQKHMKKLKGKTEKSAILGNPRISNKDLNKMPSKDRSSSQTNYSSSRSQSKAEADDHQRLLEATKEMVSLMNKDYTGFNKAKHKPPIHNSLPFH